MSSFLLFYWFCENIYVYYITCIIIMIKTPQLSSSLNSNINPIDRLVPVEYNKQIIDETRDEIWKARKEFFIENLENWWIQFSVFGSWVFDSNIYLFSDFLWVNIQWLIEETGIQLEPASSFVTMIRDGKLIIFDWNTNSSILAYDLQARGIVKLENAVLNIPSDDNYIINFENDFMKSLPTDYD